MEDVLLERIAELVGTIALAVVAIADSVAELAEEPDEERRAALAHRTRTIARRVEQQVQVAMQ